MLFFVIGTGRCGLTEVAELLARHPDVGFVSNLDDKVEPSGTAPLFRRGGTPQAAAAALP
jgi:hypothetical protein